VEAALVALDGIARAVVTVSGDHLVAYLVPDTALVRDTAAGVLDTAAIRSMLSTRLPAYLVPTVFTVLDELPLTPSGKLDRRTLPEPAFAERVFRAPGTELEATVCTAFAKVLGAARIGMDDNFFECGGTSLSATALAERLSRALGAPVPVLWLFTAPTPADLVTVLTARRADPGALDPEVAFDVLLPLRSGGSGAPLFCVHPVGGIAWSFAGLAAHLDRPLYGLQSPALKASGALPDSIEQWAQTYVAAIRSVQPAGPYHLLGWSLGGVLAHAVATELQRAGEQVALLAMLDSRLDPGSGDTGEVVISDLLGGLLGDHAAEQVPLAADPPTFAERLAALPEPFASFGVDRLTRALDAAAHSLTLVSRYRPQVFRGDLAYFVASDDPSGAAQWTTAVTGTIHSYPVPATHWRMTSAPALARIAAVLGRTD
jgi:thioesterase domain-containing protein